MHPTLTSVFLFGLVLPAAVDSAAADLAAAVAAAAADSAAVALGLLVALPPGVLQLLARPKVVVAVARRLAVVAVAVAAAAAAWPRNSPSPVRPGGTLQWAMPMDRAR